MSSKSMRQAINEALRQEMRRDPNVILIGEDLVGGAGCEGEDDAYGGVLGVTKGLVAEFGRGRIIDTPITESAIMGAAAGAALAGLRPVAELMFVDFLASASTRSSTRRPSFATCSAARQVTPLVVRAMIGGGFGPAPSTARPCTRCSPWSPA